MIDEFWVVNNAGICLYHRIKAEDERASMMKDFEQLVSGMFSGIQTMSKELTNSVIKKIEMGDRKFLFFLESELFFIVKSSTKNSDAQIKKKIQILQQNFVKKFSKELQEFSGEISAFKKFEKDLDEVFIKMSKSEKWGAGLLDI